MTGVRIVALGLRFMALWCVLAAIQSIGVVFAVQNQEHMIASGWWAVITVSIFLGFALILWCFASLIAAKLYPGEPGLEQVNFSAESALRVGCCLLGLWYVTLTIPAATRLIIMAVESARAGYAGSPDVLQNQAIYVFTLLAMVVALLVKNRSLARLLLRE